MKKFDKKELLEIIQNSTNADVERVLAKESLEPLDFLVLMSANAVKYLESMAKKAQATTLQHFGRSILLYAPIYLANFCINQCLYCGFSVKNHIERKKLNAEEIRRECEILSQKGIRHILLLTGESQKHSPPEYIKEAVLIASEYFTSVSLEVYPMKLDEYKEACKAGAEGLTVYQEVYDSDVYKYLHPGGPKRDFEFRLDTPERACMAGMRSVGIGALLGLNDWRLEAFFTALHGYYLTNKYPEVEISLSLPRMQPHEGDFTIPSPVNNKAFVQILLSFRLMLPHVGITVSTREEAEFRNNLVGLGITKMSAGSTTEVGGYAKKSGTAQFEVSDDRSIEEIKAMLYKKGYQPIFKDWQLLSPA